MIAKETCAVVVTFHPGHDVLENLERLLKDVPRVIVVDNGSTAAELALLREARDSMGFELIENGENLGIATALNVGIQRAAAQDSFWVFLFDQDSMVTEGFSASMIRAFEASPPEHRLAILVPRYVDKRMGHALNAIFQRDGSVETAMTSGSLTPMSIFREHGVFVDELFIDGVDHEFSLRLRALGYTIEECPEAVLLHSPGAPSSHRLIRAKPFQSANYSPVRRYYQERNKIWLARRYGATFPVFSRRQFHTSFKDFVKIVLFEQDKLQKTRYFFKGVWDGLREHMGRLD